MLASLILGGVSGLITTIGTFAVQDAMIGYVLNVLIIAVFNAALMYGLVTVLKSIHQQVPFSFSQFFRFDNLKQSYVLTLLIQIFTMLWTLVFIIPGMIKQYSYTLAYYILDEEPSLPPLQAITKSRELMRGHKWELFKYDLRYLLGYLVIYLMFLTCTVIGLIIFGEASFGFMILMTLIFVIVGIAYKVCVTPLMQLGRYELYVHLKHASSLE